MKITHQTEHTEEQYVSNQKKTSRTFERIGIVLSMVALYIIWGSTYLGMRVALNSFPPFTMSGIRFILAGTLLYVFLRIRHTPTPTRSQWLGSALIGILLLVCGNGGVAFAEQWVATGLAAVAVGAVPLWTALIVGLQGRWPTRLEWLGLGLGLSGVVLLNLEHGIWATPIGAIVLVLAPMCWALGSALSSRVSLPPGLMASATQMLIGGGILLLIGQLFGERIHSLPTLASLEAMAYLIIFGSLVAFCAYGYVLRRLRPVLATSYAYVNPVVAVALGVWLAGERITPIGIVAMFVILTGVGLVSLGRMRK